MTDREYLRERRDFLRSVIQTAGIALAAPTLLSVVTPRQLEAKGSRVRPQPKPERKPEQPDTRG